ncbi:metal ABC transporter solute-binding protein, Zn/Mn family [Rubrivirga sp. IMCC45206]|uniref:metal ABC transporter solute-binding protein, Zn/Mn family n=1 Tax=Rubrivirga sp. IMCC45206 TaxID=3391614 RepID=UPI00398FF709
MSTTTTDDRRRTTSLRSIALGGLWYALLLAVAACGPSQGGGAGEISERPVDVVATTSMLADLAREIGGDRVTVEGLMGPGIDPHLYRPRESDVARLVGADIVLYNGLELEGKMGEVLEQVEGRGIVAEPVAEAIDEGSLLAPPEFAGNFDPHVWMDVSLWRRVATAVADALIALDPTHRETYLANAETYQARLTALDAWVRERVAEVPEDERVLVTAHDAFNYFGRAYGFEVRGLQGLSTATEAGTADVRDLAAYVAERRIPAMFVETSVSSRNIEAVQAAVRARGHEVVIGGNLFSDALGDPGTPEGTYEGMIRHNVETIVSALSGEG